MGWILEQDELREADVIRWTEAIWPLRRRKKPRPLGSQQVTAQITAIDGGLISLKVLKAEIIDVTYGVALSPYKENTALRRKISTLRRNPLERLLWSEEEARAMLLFD